MYSSYTSASTVYALTFVGLNFRGFRGSIAIHESFILLKFRPDRQRLCNYVTNRENKNAKTAKIGNPRKFNPAKIKAYTVTTTYIYDYIIFSHVQLLYVLYVCICVHYCWLFSLTADV